jgi:hypothetical protein
VTSNKALVIGNGESRRSIDLENYRNDYVLVGCNAVHRDLEVDHLVCCDKRMAEEAANATGYPTIYTRTDWIAYFKSTYPNVEQLPELPYSGTLKQDQSINWGSGVYALLLATALPVSTITVIGFDLYPTNDTVNNIYKDTVNYAKSSSRPVDYSYWVYQTAKLIELNPNKTFQFVNNEEWSIPSEWKKFNVQSLTINSFTSILVQ